MIRNEKEFIIDGLNLFRDGIKPEWEDKNNAKGYHFQVEFDVQPHTLDLLEKVYTELWANFVFSLIGEEPKYSEHISGMRYLYKPQKTNVRFELWMLTSMPRKYYDMKSMPPVTEDEAQEEINTKVYDELREFINKKISKVLGKEKNYDIRGYSHVDTKKVSALIPN